MLKQLIVENVLVSSVKPFITKNLQNQKFLFVCSALVDWRLNQGLYKQQQMFYWVEFSVKSQNKEAYIVNTNPMKVLNNFITWENKKQLHYSYLTAQTNGLEAALQWSHSVGQCLPFLALHPQDGTECELPIASTSSTKSTATTNCYPKRQWFLMVINLHLIRVMSSHKEKKTVSVLKLCSKRGFFNLTGSHRCCL